MEEKSDKKKELNLIEIPRLNKNINGKKIFDSKSPIPSSERKNSKDISSEKKVQSVKKRQAVAIFENKKKNLSKETVFNFLMKNPTSRALSEIRNVAEYLSNNFQYFAKLRNEDSQLKVEKLTKICRLEKAFKDENIITFGEIGDKFYIVLEGVVEIFKPKFVEINESPGDFLDMLIQIKETDSNDLRYKRIKNKNHDFFKNLPQIELSELAKEFAHIKYKQLFFMEEDEKMGEYGEGFSFGDIALINKAPRNATIKAKENCVLLTIGKDDYTKAILEFQKRKLSKEIDIFVKTYSFFQYFNNDKIIQLFNCLTKVEIYKGEYLYKQNMNADSIYILCSGSFLVYSSISFSWINNYIDYIDYSDKNILLFLMKKKHLKFSELLKTIQKLQNNIKNSNIEMENNELWDKIDEKQTSDNLYKLKKDEEKLNSPENIFQLNLKKINYNEILGLEEVFEFKKRFCSCKCISEKAELKAIKIIDLLKLLANLNEEELMYLLNIINERKKVLKSQILNAIKNLDKELIFNFDIRYENIIKSSEDKKDEDKTNMLLTALKIKGYKTSIQDILDKNISLFPKENNNQSDILKKMKRKNKSSQQILNDYLKQKGTTNQFKFNKIKNCLKDENQNIVNSLFNKFQICRNISDNNRHKKILGNNSLHKSSSNNIFGFDKPKLFFNIKRNIHKNSFDNEKKKRNLNSIKIRTQRLYQSRSSPDFTNKTRKTKSIRDTITVYDSRNFPRFSLTKKNYEIKNKKANAFINNDLSLKENGYKTFFNIFNADKNFYLGAEFQKKLKKEFKQLDSIYDKNIIKKQTIMKNEFFL